MLGDMMVHNQKKCAAKFYYTMQNKSAVTAKG